jgi:hypothetical protein
LQPNRDDLSRQAGPIRGRLIRILPAPLAKVIIQRRSHATSRGARRLIVLAVAAAIAILGTVAAVRIPSDPKTQKPVVAELERDLTALEGSGCLGPTEFERRVKTLLAASGWTGWTTSLRLGLGVPDGVCGAVSALGNDGSRNVSGAIDQDNHQIVIHAEPPRAAQAKASKLGSLFDETGARCWNLTELKARIRQQVGGMDLSVGIEVYDAPAAIVTNADGTRERATTGVGIGGARGDRWKAGCAVLTRIALHGDGRGMTVELIQKGAEGK